MLKYLSFKDIFPTCKDLYHKNSSQNGLSHINGKIKTPCNNFDNSFRSNKQHNYNLVPDCTKFGPYLYKIKDYSEDKRKPYCNFFIYELKRLVRNKNPKFKKFDELYKKLIETYETADVKGLDICNDYISLMNDTVYDIFEKFDKLYYNFKDLRSEKNNKHVYVNECVKKYEELIKLDKTKINSTIKEELDKFKSDFHNYLRVSENKYEVELLNSSLGKLDTSATTAEALSGGTTYSVTWTSTGVLFFAILIIIFIVYNYTAYGTYLRPGKRKLKNMWNKKNKKHDELINFFERTQKNIIQNKHNILYNSVEYS
ncbi:variable surface protein [Plasmodium gonderi]|uniref:Variable surface protein n=1 Tax=Plasmodium gonderi TaxID=77519 RepID=A0A1Y1JSR4_PLAGO|nr:variable surface protein [Plasmodium gonderi]GAW84478.1 variable surface protein [Plasmodium gonderi]